MIKHYFNPMSRAVSTNWMLEELGVEHEQVFIDFMAGENATPEYKAINPMQKLPALVDGETVVTEAAAICAYLADKFPEKNMAPKVGSAERGIYYRYMFVSGSTLEPAFTLSSAGLEHPEPRTAGWGDMERVLATVEALTPESDWVLGEQFTAADIVFGGLLDMMLAFQWAEASEKVIAYVERIRQRPAYQKTHVAFD